MKPTKIDLINTIEVLKKHKTKYKDGMPDKRSIDLVILMIEGQLNEQPTKMSQDEAIDILETFVKSEYNTSLDYLKKAIKVLMDRIEDLENELLLIRELQE